MFHLTPLTGQTKTKKKQLVLEALAKTKGNVTQAAEELGVSRTWLSRTITKLGVRKEAR